MGDLFWNKIFGAILAVFLGIMGLRLLSETVFSAGHEGGGHGEAEEQSLNDWAHSRFAYYTEIAESGAGGGEEVEEVYDLGALLANADASRGERSFKAKCTTCHTIEDGGPNGTGPNLHGVVGAPRGSHAGFGYSSAMQAVAGQPWTYTDMDAWLENPSSYIRGTSMAFAGLRRDEERADVIAYLASNSPGAPAFPEPLPEEETVADPDAAEGPAAEAGALDEEEGTVSEADAVSEGDPVEATLTPEELEENPTTATGEIDVIDAVTDMDESEGNEGEVEMAPDSTAPEDDPMDPSHVNQEDEEGLNSED